MIVVETPESDKHRDLDTFWASVPEQEQATLRAFWDLAGTVPEPEVSDPEAQTRVLRHLESLAVDISNHPKRRNLWWGAVAASILIAAFGLFLWSLPVSQMAPLGERLTVALPDGSTVELNSGATIRYERRFEGTRTVALEGEAYFSVVYGTDPFVVETFNAAVQVLGTRFNVKAWPEAQEPATTVTLESGRVRLAPRVLPEQGTELMPGETRSLGAADQTFSLADTTLVHVATAWRTGGLIFKDAKLGTILEEVERRFDVEVVLNAQTLKPRRISLALRRPTSAALVIENLCIPLGLQYRETTTGYMLYEPLSK